MAARLLDEAAVIAIREARASGASTRQLAEVWDLHQTVIAKICRGDTYREFGGPLSAGRRRGVELPQAMLDEGAVGEIKAHLAAGVATRELARMYGVSRSAVRAISAGRSWRHVEADEREARGRLPRPGSKGRVVVERLRRGVAHTGDLAELVGARRALRQLLQDLEYRQLIERTGRSIGRAIEWRITPAGARLLHEEEG